MSISNVEESCNQASQPLSIHSNKHDPQDDFNSGSSDNVILINNNINNKDNSKPTSADSAISELREEIKLAIKKGLSQLDERLNNAEQKINNNKKAIKKNKQKPSYYDLEDLEDDFSGKISDMTEANEIWHIEQKKQLNNLQTKLDQTKKAVDQTSSINPAPTEIENMRQYLWTIFSEILSDTVESTKTEMAEHRMEINELKTKVAVKQSNAELKHEILKVFGRSLKELKDFNQYEFAKANERIIIQNKLLREVKDELEKERQKRLTLTRRFEKLQTNFNLLNSDFHECLRDNKLSENPLGNIASYKENENTTTTNENENTAKTNENTATTNENENTTTNENENTATTNENTTTTNENENITRTNENENTATTNETTKTTNENGNITRTNENTTTNNKNEKINNNPIEHSKENSNFILAVISTLDSFFNDEISFNKSISTIETLNNNKCEDFKDSRVSLLNDKYSESSIATERIDPYQVTYPTKKTKKLSSKSGASKRRKKKEKIEENLSLANIHVAKTLYIDKYRICGTLRLRIQQQKESGELSKHYECSTFFAGYKGYRVQVHTLVRCPKAEVHFYVGVRNGKHDNKLSWPFKQKFCVKLSSKMESTKQVEWYLPPVDRHWEKVINKPEKKERVFTEAIGPFDIKEFMELEDVFLDVYLAL